MSSTRAPRARSSAVAQAQQANKGSQTVWIIVGVVIVIGLAAVLAVALAQEEPDSKLAQTAEVTVEGALPRLPENGVSLAIGQPAPEVTGTALKGGEISITNEGKPRVIGFFTHWCPACRAEVPVVSEWYNNGGAPDDVDFMAVSTAVNPQAVNYPPTRWFENEDWAVPTMLDDSASTVANSFGLSAYPFWVAIDADGNVVDQLTGQLSVDEINSLFDRAREGLS